MLEKLEAVGEASKKILLYLLMPLIVVGVFIYFLLRKIFTLETEVEGAKGQEKLKELQGEQKEIDSNANDAVSEFERAQRDYLLGRSGPVRESGGSSEASDSDKGSGAVPGPSTPPDER